MKHWLGAALILFCSVVAQAEGPYVQGLWTQGAPVYVSQGAIFHTNDLSYDTTFTNVAAAYHPLSAGSIIPQKLQPFIPPESWACTIGGGYAASKGGGRVGSGCGLNLLDSVRGWASELLLLSDSARLQDIGEQVAPGKGPFNLFTSYQWTDDEVHPLKFSPRWFFGAAYGF